MKSVTNEDLCACFGTKDDALSEHMDFIKSKDLRYEEVSGEKREALISEVWKKIEADTQVIGSPERKAVWEKGWKENFDNYVSSGYDTKQLIPKFIRPNQVVRFRGRYIEPASPSFELDFMTIYKRWLFPKWLRDVDSVYEFGCGTGLDLLLINDLLPGKKLVGLDFVRSPAALLNKIRETRGINLEGRVFDMIHPDFSLNLEGKSAVLTAGSVEQLAGKFDEFIRFLLQKKPNICLNIEPVIELFDEKDFFDYLHIKFHRKRGYTEGFLSRLKELESQGLLRIEQVIKPGFGSLYMEGYNAVIWRPV